MCLPKAITQKCVAFQHEIYCDKMCKLYHVPAVVKYFQIKTILPSGVGTVMSAAAFRCALITLEKREKKPFRIEARHVKHLTRVRTETLSDKQSDERADREGSQERQSRAGRASVMEEYRGSVKLRSFLD